MNKLAKFLEKRAGNFELPEFKVPEFRTTTMNYNTEGNMAAELSMLHGGTLAQQVGAKDGSQLGSYVGSLLVAPVLVREVGNLGDMLETAYKTKNPELLNEIKRNTKQIFTSAKAKTFTGKLAESMIRARNGAGRALIAGRILPVPALKSILRLTGAGVLGSGLGYITGGLAGHYLNED